MPVLNATLQREMRGTRRMRRKSLENGGEEEIRTAEEDYRRDHTSAEAHTAVSAQAQAILSKCSSEDRNAILTT